MGSQWFRGLAKRRTAVFGASLAIVLAGVGAIAGSPGVSLAAPNGRTTSFTVTGVRAQDRVYVFRVGTDGAGASHVVSASVAIVRSGGPLALTVGNTVRPGVYVAVEISPRGAVTVSAPVGFHVVHFTQPVTLAASPTVVSPRAVLVPLAVRADTVGPGQLNGPTCGTLVFQQSRTGWIGTWSGCAQLSSFVGGSVWVIGAAPLVGGRNPFDNPPAVLGFWVTTVPPAVGGNSPVVTVNIGFNNDVAAANGSPFVPGEWFDMQLSSQSVESPAGQLPEAPWAVALPLVLGLTLWATVNRQLREVR